MSFVCWSVVGHLHPFVRRHETVEPAESAARVLRSERATVAAARSVHLGDLEKSRGSIDGLATTAAN